MPVLMPNGRQQYFNPTTGAPLAGGKLYTYTAGTSTPQVTYQDAAGTTPNANPITLDSTGSALVFWSGSYKIVLQDSLGNTVYTEDNYSTLPDASSNALAGYTLDTGTANAYQGAYSTGIPALGDGMVLRFKAKNANTGQSTFTPNAGVIAAAPILNLLHTVLIGGEIAVNGDCDVQWNISLNGGSGAWVLKTATGGASQINALSVNTPSINGGPLSGLRNALINPEMAIDQRNNGAAQTFTAGAALAYCVDRWYGYCTGANVTGQRVAGSGNSQYRYQFTGAASVTGIGFGQRIETANSVRFAGTTATLAVDLANSLLTTVNWTAYYANTADTFGSLSSPTKTQIATGAFTVNSTVSRYYAQIAIPAAATTGIEIVFTVSAQTSGTWTIGRAALLPSGTNETYIDPRPIGLEMMLCQRYYEVIGDYTNSFPNISAYTSSGSAFAVPIPFAADKRTVPTLTKNGTWSVSNCAQPAAINPSVRGFVLSVTASSTASFQYYAGAAGCNVTASAEL